MGQPYAFERIKLTDHTFWYENINSIPLDRFEKLIQKLEFEKDQNKSHSFILKHGQMPVGFIQVFNVLEAPASSGMIEIMIAEKLRKSGHAKAGIKLLEEFCFNELRLLKLLALISSENEASLSLFKSLGYKPTSQEMWVKHKTNF